MIEKQGALKLSIGQVILQVDASNADGTPKRWKVNGQVKTWKTRPDDFQVPLKHGLKGYDYLSQHTGEFFTTDFDLNCAQCGKSFLYSETIEVKYMFTTRTCIPCKKAFLKGE